MKMSTLRFLNLKTLRYFGFLVLAAIVVYFGRSLLVLYSDSKGAGDASSSISDTTLIQEKQPEKGTVESHQEILAKNLASPNLPRASLNLVLVGTVKGDHGYSQAIIEDRQGKTQGKYIVGDAIRGARLVMISRTKVVLSVNGQDQVLDLDSQWGGVDQRGAPQASSSPSGEPNWDERSSLGYAQVMLKMRLKPFIKDGNQEGFEVKSILGDSPLKEIGVEDGDIIKSINGEPIDSDLDILRIHDAVTDGDPFAISVVRAGKTLILSNQAK
jgi:type II secretion system protein C